MGAATVARRRTWSAMTVAVIVATATAEDGSSAALLPFADHSPVERLVTQLRRRGMDAVHVVTLPQWVEPVRQVLAGHVGVAVSGSPLADVLAGAAGNDVLLAEGHAVGHDAVLDWVLRDGVTATLVSESGEHLGLLFAPADQCGALAGAALAVPQEDAVRSVTAAAVTAANVRRVTPGPLYWSTVRTTTEASAARERTDQREDDLLLAAAVKPDDSFFPTFFVSPYSRYIARWAAQRGLTPNQISVVSMLLGVVAAACFALGTRAGLVAGAVVLQVSFTADCVDGQVARYTRRFSPLGAWLDSTFDRVKEYLVYAALAIGGVRAGGAESIWILAAAALALQTVRHMAVFGYEERTDMSVAVHPRRGAPGGLARVPVTGVQALSRLDRISGARWVKRILVLPIGERFALVSLGAALTNPRTTFIWLLTWGAVATAYVLGGRLLRSTA